MGRVKTASDKELYRRIGFAVMKLRQREGLTTLVLAERAGVHRNTVYRIESGLSISVSALFKIADVLEAGVDDLASYSPNVVHCEDLHRIDDEKPDMVVCGTELLF